MEVQFSEEFRRKFLLMFVSELILNSAKRDIVKLQSIVEEKAKPLRETEGLREVVDESMREIRRAITEEKEKAQFVPKPVSVRDISDIKPVQQNVKQIPQSIQQPRLAVQPTPIRQTVRSPSRILFIPEPNLPKHLEYLKPQASPIIKIDVDLGKLNSLLRDPAVKLIEGSPDENVKVVGAMGTRQTDIILTKEEVDSVIMKFSEASKIPVMEGVYRVAVGNLILSAIISEVIGSRFVIKKMPPAQPQVAQTQQEIIPRKPVIGNIPR